MLISAQSIGTVHLKCYLYLSFSVFGSFTVPLSLLFESLSLSCLFFFVGSAILNFIAASIVV